MSKQEKVKSAVTSILQGELDTDILDYICGVLEDEDFEFGSKGAGVYDALGDILVGHAIVNDEPAAKAVCEKLAARLTGGDVTAPASHMRALETGPISMSAADPKGYLYHAPDVKDMIQTKLPTISEKDKAKLEKRAAKEEASARSAMALRTAAADAAQRGNRPIIIRSKGSGGSRDIHLENFNVSNGGKDLISEATVMLAYGRRYGLVGRNGTGKTTFLRALSTREIPGLPDNIQVLHVEQEVVGDDTPVLQAVLGCDIERSELLEREAEILAKLNKDGKASSTEAGANGAAAAHNGVEPVGAAESAALGAELQTIYARLEEIDAHGAPARAACILAGLSFDAEMMQRATKTFSGGWRMRVSLACALFVEPDVLLLDEPTNHLDLHAVLWLEDYLLRWPKTLVVVSHAREFLNAVCTDILHLHSRKVITYKGDYNTFMRTMSDRVKNARKAAEASEAKKAHIQAFIDRFRYNANRAALVQSRIKALERMADVEEVEVDPEYCFKFPTPPDMPTPPIIGFHDVSFNYPGGPILFRDLNFGLDLESRVAFVGANGVGKSTLLKLISGGLEPTIGHVQRNAKVRLAVFSQHHVDGLDLALSPLGVMLRAFPLVPEQDLRSHLGSFGLSGTLATQAMYTLSGGQKSRVAFAKITWTKPHLLLLDEPSNHLDIDAVNALIEGLATFKGGVLMVSHDQFLIEATVDELWVCDEGRVTPYSGTFQEYKQLLRDKK